MNGKIGEKGCLWIERAGKMASQMCPLDSNGAVCGDWCPQFGEPQQHEIDGIAGWHIHICHHRHLVFDTFTDERTNPGKDEK